MGLTGCNSHSWPSKRERVLLTSFMSLWLPRVLEHCLVFSSAPSPFYVFAQENALSRRSCASAPPSSEGGLRRLVSSPGRCFPPGRAGGQTNPAKKWIENAPLAPGMGSDIPLCPSWWQKWTNQILLCSCWNYFMFREPAVVGCAWAPAMPPPSRSFILAPQ